MKDLNRVKDYRIAELERVESQHKYGDLRAQEALRYAESIIATVREPLVVLDASLKVISANRSFYKTFQVTPSETLRHAIYELGNGQWDIPQLQTLLEGILSEKEVVENFEVIHNFKDIGRKIMLLNGRRIYRKELGTQTILLAIEDITERKGLESLLRDSEERYRRVFETARDGIVLLEKSEGNITHANPAFAELSGYSTEETIGKKLHDVGVLSHMGDFQRMLEALDESGIILYSDVPVRTKAGQDIDTDLYLVDKTRLVQCNIREITERKVAEKALKVSEQKYRNIFENIIEGIFQITPEGRFLTVNPVLAYMYGYSSPEEMIETITDIGRQVYVNPDERFEFLRILHEKGSIKGFELQLKKKDGSPFWVSMNARCVYDENGNILYYEGTSEDITERKQAEADLKESKALTEAVVENIPLMIFLKEAKDLRFVMFNRAGEELLGYDRRDLIGKNNLDLFPPEQAAHFMAKDREVLDGESGMLDIPEEPILTAGKGQRLLHTRKVCIRGSDGTTKFLLGISEDITSRKLAEDELKQTLEKLRRSLLGTIQVMSNTVEIRDPYTAGHQRRVSSLARAIAQEINLPKDAVDAISVAANIHDIGKISVPAEILSKPGKLTNIEMSLIQIHPQTGYDMLKDVGLPSPIAEIVLQHHERLDGSGYPQGLKADQILIETRILVVADVVEAIASNRPYRPALGIDVALEEIEKNKGTLYDPQVSEVCMNLFREKGFGFE
jgi:PAS domain S-box-containing protein